MFDWARRDAAQRPAWRERFETAGSNRLTAFDTLDQTQIGRALCAVAALGGVGLLALALSLNALSGSASVADVRLASDGADRMPALLDVTLAEASPAAGEPDTDTRAESQAGPEMVVAEVIDQPARTAPRPEPSIERVALTVSRGDTLANLLGDAGVSARETYLITQAMQDLFDPRRIREGQEITVTIEQPPRLMTASLGLGGDGAGGASLGEPRLAEVAIRTDVDRHVRVQRTEEGAFVAVEDVMPLETQYARAKGEINSSLYMAAIEVGVPDSVFAEMMRMYAYDIDFQRDIREGDSFEVFYTYLTDETGAQLKTGEVIFASLTTRGKERQLYRYQPEDASRPDYFDESGRSAKRFLMKTPIDGARMSSGYGMRRHPILGYNRMHKGIDFAAPRGTPIYAAGNGVIEVAGRNGSFGNYIRIRHANGYKTAYAHLHNFARGIRAGARVEQGETIGYVGTTGRSTGPHLHYEVHHQGDHINPASIRVPSGEVLEGQALADFQAHYEELRALIAATPLMTVPSNTQIAQSDTEGDSATARP